jgi:Phosphotransferase enzyme family/Glycosyl transferase family 2
VTDSTAKVSDTVTPELSVVICTIGTPAVADTVESVAGSAAHGSREVETLVVWSGTDTPPSLPEGTRVLEVFPAGLAHSRNRGLEASAAPVVAFVDDDEVVDPGWAAAVLDAFAHDAEPAGVFGPIAPRDDRGLAYCHYEGGGAFRVFEPGTAPWRIGSGGNMAFRRDVLLFAGGFDPLFGLGSVSRSAEETELIRRLLGSRHVLAWAPGAIVYHPTKTEAERLESRFPYAYGLGKLVRRHRDPLLAARYGKEIAQALTAAARARDRRRLRETAGTLRGFAAGAVFRADARSPEAVLERAPESIVAELDGARPEPSERSYRPDPHFVYLAGADRILHVYVNPTAGLRRGLSVRERVRESGVPGVPGTFSIEEGVDSLWVLEERLDGAPASGDPADWFPQAAEWALRLGSERGHPLREGSWWAEEAAPAVEGAPEEIRARVEAALETLGDLPAVQLHGDFQPKNILVSGSSPVGVLDWEHAHDAGPPGLDLLFVAAMARSDRPDGDLLAAVAAGNDPDWAPLHEFLRHMGVSARELVIAALAVWAADEDARTAAPGMPRAEPIYRRLLLELGPTLAG